MLKVLDSTTAIVQGTFFTYPMNTGVPGVRFHSPIWYVFYLHWMSYDTMLRGRGYSRLQGQILLVHGTSDPICFHGVNNIIGLFSAFYKGNKNNNTLFLTSSTWTLRPAIRIPDRSHFPGLTARIPVAGTLAPKNGKMVGLYDLVWMPTSDDNPTIGKMRTTNECNGKKETKTKHGKIGEWERKKTIRLMQALPEKSVSRPLGHLGLYSSPA